MHRCHPNRRLAAGALLPATLLLCLALGTTSAAAAVPGISSPAAPGSSAFVPGEAIVSFEPGTSPAERRESREQVGVRFEDSVGLARTEVIEVEGSVKAAVQELERQPDVAYAQPNYRYRTLAVAAPNDTFFGNLWGLSDPSMPSPGVDALAAWERTRGGDQVIAVVDTGVDLTHPDLEPNLWTNPAPNPVEQDLHGFDFVDDDGDPDDYEFHGTHVAGTAAAVEDNGAGIAGVAPDARIMAVRVLDGDGSGSTADIASGIVYAANHGADVINLSLGGPGSDTAMSNAVDVAAAKDVVVVAAAGNDGRDNDATPTVPCTLPQANLICVAALDDDGSLASFSNFGANSVDLAAPGTSILSAKADYGPPVFSNGFEPGTTELWGTSAQDGGIPWSLTPTAASGSQGVTDSVGGDYGQASAGAEWAISQLFTNDPVSLLGERGCRIHFQAIYETEQFFDFFGAGAVGTLTGEDVTYLHGTSRGYPNGFRREEASISDLDGRPDVHPWFGIFSDESLEFDGAYVDDVRLICRDETYTNAISSGSQYDQPNAGSYVEFQGTSMAAPHVAGVAALVRAAVPSASAVATVNAIRNGAAPMPAAEPAKPTATQRIADACDAISFARAGNLVVGCGAVTAAELPPGTVAETEAAIRAANPPAVVPPPPGRLPQTFFSSRPPKVIQTATRRARAVFVFGSDAAESTFVCRVDTGLFRACPSRFARRFPLGRHSLRVIARDAQGNVDPTAAVYRFRVKPTG